MADIYVANDFAESAAITNNEGQIVYEVAVTAVGVSVTAAEQAGWGGIFRRLR